MNNVQQDVLEYMEPINQTDWRAIYSIKDQRAFIEDGLFLPTYYRKPRPNIGRIWKIKRYFRHKYNRFMKYYNGIIYVYRDGAKNMYYDELKGNIARKIRKFIPFVKSNG